MEPITSITSHRISEKKRHAVNRMVQWCGRIGMSPGECRQVAHKLLHYRTSDLAALIPAAKTQILSYYSRRRNPVKHPYDRSTVYCGTCGGADTIQSTTRKGDDIVTVRCSRCGTPYVISHQDVRRLLRYWPLWATPSVRHH